MPSNDKETRVWGDKDTSYFFSLTPDKILDAVESAGLRPTGRCLQLNSMENRVYEVEIQASDPAVPDYSLIAKFYRPGRWSEPTILDEHQFLLELAEIDIPVVTPIPFPDASTLQTVSEAGIYFALFAKSGGRCPEELSDEQFSIVGRLLARMHNAGAVHPATHRVTLSPESYGIQNLELLRSLAVVPEAIEIAYGSCVESICQLSTQLFTGVPMQRIHGDCHLGNILWGNHGPFLVDFDDMLNGPCVQDLWLLLPGRDDYAQSKLSILLDAYEQMRPFDRSSLRLIESLRALRLIHFSAWIAKRWSDPAFPRAFPDFGTDSYWREQLSTLREQESLIRSALV